MLRSCSCKSTPGHTYRCEVCGGVGHDFDDVSQTAAMPVTQIPSTQTPFLPTGLDAVDEVLGGGVVEGAVYLLGGEPGIGKSTLLLQVAGGLLSHGRRVLYVSAEETAERVRERCERLGLLNDNLLVTTEAEVGCVCFPLRMKLRPMCWCWIQFSGCTTTPSTSRLGARRRFVRCVSAFSTTNAD